MSEILPTIPISLFRFIPWEKFKRMGSVIVTFDGVPAAVLIIPQGESAVSSYCWECAKEVGYLNNTTMPANAQKEILDSLERPKNA